MYKVLLVDDEPLITKGLMALLDWEDYGFEIAAAAESGEEALSYLKENPVDILITDILMDKMSGLELISEIKKIQPHTKTIVLTGYQEFGFIKQGLLLGIENYLVKPVDEDELLTTVQNIGQKLNQSLTVPDLHEETTTLQDNTLWRYINGEIDKNDCLERLSFYNIQFHQPTYTISILNFEQYVHTAVSKEIRDFIEKEFRATVLFSPDQEMLIIFGGSSEEELFKWNHQLVEHLCNGPIHTGLFYLSMGKSVTKVDDFDYSFMCARENSLSQLFSEPNVLLSSRLVMNKHDEGKKLQELKERFVKHLLQENEAVFQMVDLFFQELTGKTKFISPQVVKRYTFDLISYIHHSLQPEDLSQYTAAVERMVYGSDIHQVKTILGEYCEELILSINNQANMRSPIVQNVLKFIHAHYKEGISLKTLGNQFHVNVIYLGQLFQKEVGVVFSEYLNRYRLEKAKELLKTTHERAGEIGKKVGYSDTAYFYKQFKKTVGTTPSEWRKIKINVEVM